VLLTGTKGSLNLQSLRNVIGSTLGLETREDGLLVFSVHADTGSIGAEGGHGVSIVTPEKQETTYKVH
jgi:hypothetical protein